MFIQFFFQFIYPLTEGFNLAIGSYEIGIFFGVITIDVLEGNFQFIVCLPLDCLKLGYSIICNGEFLFAVRERFAEFFEILLAVLKYLLLA